MTETKNSNSLVYSILIISGIIIIFLIAVVLWLLFANNNSQSPLNNQSGINTPTNTSTQPNQDNQVAKWQTYTSNEYFFSVNYPESWNKNESFSNKNEPVLNIYTKPWPNDTDFPLNHFDNENQVSFFPLGIGTEGVVYQSKDFNLATDFEISDNSKIYVLKDGTPFAAYIKPQNPPSGWNPSGFIWMRVKVDNLESTCLKDGEVLAPKLCNPLSDGSKIQTSGTIDPSIWTMEKQIISKIIFNQINQLDNLIALDNLKSGDVIKTPLKIEGEAKGTWYFEASFPIVLTDWDGKIIAETTATAQSDWMTKDFVPFTANLEFSSPYNEGDPEFMKNGSLILQKANPSGMPENDNALELPIKFD